MANERPGTALDVALRRLEKAFREAPHNVRHLREAIEVQRKAGAFNEKRVLVEIEKILTRTELDVEDVDNLADRLMKEAP